MSVLDRIIPWGLGTEVPSGVQGQSPVRKSGDPEAETVCRHCLQILTAEMIKIFEFRTILHRFLTILLHGGLNDILLGDLAPSPCLAPPLWAILSPFCCKLISVTAHNYQNSVQFDTVVAKMKRFHSLSYDAVWHACHLIVVITNFLGDVCDVCLEKSALDRIVVSGMTFKGHTMSSIMKPFDRSHTTFC